MFEGIMARPLATSLLTNSAVIKSGILAPNFSPKNLYSQRLFHYP
jgi:hypothetical protein